MSGLTIGIGDLWENYSYRNIRESLLRRAGVGSCLGVSNHCMFGLANQQAGRFAPATQLELIRFWPFPFGELMWHLITQVNNGDLADQITVFYPRRGKCRRFITFLVYAMVYPSISSNLVTLATLSPWYDSVCTHTCSPFLRKTLLR